MTLGVTGVVWLPRTATGNSTALTAGAGPAPLAAASGAWTSVAGSFADAVHEVGSVMAGLGVGWEGAAADGAQARLASFAVWAEKAAVLAGAEAGKAAAQSTAYSVALAAMPTLVEIAAVKATVAASYGAGGALNGSALAAEAADKALDIRAAAVMEIYEAASSHLAVSTEFDRPPTIVTDAASDGAAQVQSAQSYRDSDIGAYKGDAESGSERTRPTIATSPAQAAVSAIGAATQNPAFASAAGQVGSAAGSVAGSGVSTAASTAGNLGSAAMTALTGGHQPGAAGGGPSGTNAHAVSPASTRPVSLSGVGSAGAGFALGANGSLAPAGTSALGSDKPTASTGATSALAGNAESTGAARGATGGPMAGSRPAEDDDEHRSKSYEQQFEHFADGRTVAPAVIGADVAWTDE